jgi:serine/threonine-protein kinase
MVDRKPRGPLITLLVGLVTALVLGVLSANATEEDVARRNAASEQGAAPAATTQAAPAPTTPPATTAPPAAPAGLRAAYAGEVNGGGASIAIAVRDGGAIAYLCDGRRIEAWMLGSATDGKLELSGDGGASLTGTYDKDSAAGTVTAKGRKWTLDIPVAKKPSGLYRSTADLRGARVVTGWIVLANGDQVGIANSDGRTAPAPPLDLSDRTATVNGEEVTADPIDGTTGTGF